MSEIRTVTTLVKQRASIRMYENKLAQAPVDPAQYIDSYGLLVAS
jgi:hypothetical protein